MTYKLRADVDVIEELEPYINNFGKVKITEEKMIACSPFRADKHPSFVVFIEKGNWFDSGSATKKGGSFLELMSFLTGDTEEDLFHYLQQKYGKLKDIDQLKLQMNFTLSKPKKVFTKEELKPYMFRHPYLGKRGISEKTQRAFKVGYCSEYKAVVIPWADIKGNPVKLKFRTVTGKKFWYSSEGQGVSNHLFGLYFVVKHKFTTVFIVESEIDCLYLWSHGIPAIATGTAFISKEQVKLLKRSGIETLVIASDNDAQGYKFKHQLIDLFGGWYQLEEVVFPKDVKDVNEFTTEQLQSIETKGIVPDFLG